MASSRTVGPRVGGLVPWTITGPTSLAATTIWVLPLPTCRYRVGRITYGGTGATDVFTLSVGNEVSATAFLNAQSLAASAVIGDYASADLAEKSATSGTSYLLLTLTRSSTATIANGAFTIWMWMSSPPPALGRRGDPGAQGSVGL